MAETALAYSIPKGIGLRDDQGVDSAFFTASLAPGSRRGSISRRVLRCILLAACLAMPALPQCQMCRTAAAAQQEKAAKALNAGIVVLGLPPVAILLGIGGLLYRYRNGSGINNRSGIK